MINGPMYIAICDNCNTEVKVEIDLASVALREEEVPNSVLEYLEELGWQQVGEYSALYCEECITTS